MDASKHSFCSFDCLFPTKQNSTIPQYDNGHKPTTDHNKWETVQKINTTPDHTQSHPKKIPMQNETAPNTCRGGKAEHWLEKSTRSTIKHHHLFWSFANNPYLLTLCCCCSLSSKMVLSRIWVTDIVRCDNQTK